MIGKKINQLATELAPVSTDLTIIGDPISGVSKKITLAQLGAIFSGAVSFYTNLAGFPATGDINVIYCAKDTQKLYLWSGSAYVEVFPSQALLDTYQLRSEKGVSNGYASLDSTGKVPISQLPSSIMEYKGTWSASTNTPTLANGTGDTGDVYICNSPGSVNFGAGAITFAVGDYVIYSGSIWQRSSGAVGTVTSVAASITGNAIGITGSPVTTSGTLAFAFAGTGAQYIKGDGTLATFPSTIAQAERLITEVYNSTGATLTKGTIVYINGGQGNLPTVTKALATGDSTSAQTFGVVQADITNNNNGYVVVAGKLSDLDTQAYTPGTQLYLSSTTAGTWTSTKQYAPAHLVYVGIVVRAHPTQGIVEVKIQNGYELDELHNVAAQTPTNNDGLFWESATSLWKNKSIATVLGYTPQPQLSGTGFVKISGTTISYDNSTYVTTDTFQTISASKTFSVGLSLASAGGTNQLTSFINTSSLFSGSAGSNVLGFNSANNIYFGKGSNNGGVLQWTNSTVRYYTLPDATGTIALTSDIPSLTGYVPYTGATANVNLGTYDLLSRSVYIEGTASYQAGLLMKQISGFNFVTGAYTQVVPSGIYDLYVVHNQTNGTRRRYAISVASLQDGDDFQYLVPRKNGTFAMTSDIPSLTGYVQGTGTTNYLPKFTGTSTIGNSQIFDNGSGVGIGTATPSGFTRTLKINAASGTIGLLLADADTDRAGFYIDAGTTAPAYIFTNNSKPLVFSVAGAERMRLDASGNLGLGVNPSAWSAFKVLELPNGAHFSSYTSGVNILDIGINYYFNGAGYIYNNTDAASQYQMRNGEHRWFNAPSGTAGNAISFTQAMTLDASGRLGIGTTSPLQRLHVYNSSSSTAAIFQGSSNSYIQLGVTNESYIGNVSGALLFETGGSTRLTLASTGAATFSSSVTAGGINTFLSGGLNNTTYALNASISSSASASSVAPVARFSNNGGGYVTKIMFSDNNRGDAYITHVAGSAFTPSTRWLGFGVDAVDQMIINASGNVGIGTTSPGTLLTLQGNGVSPLVFAAYSANPNADIFLQSSASTNAVRLRNGADDFQIFTNGSERMRITSGGNVAIGTTSSSARLTTYLADGTNDNRLVIQQGSNGYASGINLLGNNDDGTRYNYINSATTGNTAMWQIGGGGVTNTMIMYTAGSERMRISSAGLIYMNNLGGYSGSFSDVRYDTSSKELFYQTSSRRYKDNIVNLENTLSKVNQLRAVRFIDKHTQRENCGFIAEEVIEIIPDVVFKKEIDGKLEVEGINYSDFAPFIIKALQEQQAEIEALKLELKNK